ncbi:hypothetical protein [Kutzneria albida]|uniref:Uncharacterized protein n=1 Tax=Kutzneria albida DSM 43870 TaxID=1449976 RepID=W5WAY2_9PSEU|nr:hypothetical protein [Kutzneria albida]AHH98293.1 hypothetical protein KALB_4931 [Kutzneria albida DSM 43870]
MTDDADIPANVLEELVAALQTTPNPTLLNVSAELATADDEELCELGKRVARFRRNASAALGWLAAECYARGISWPLIAEQFDVPLATIHGYAAPFVRARES